jgi:perosamine synthetase
MSGKIYYTKPSITELEVAYATDAARNGWGERCYEYIHKFEALFRAYVGTKYAIATSSCTGALHMGLAALGVGPGDEVILADINWIASAAPITYLGAKPVLVDVLRDTWCIDPERAEAAITKRTKAIIATHIYGNVCDIGRLLEIGRRRGVAIIEDAAEAIGSRWQGQHTGSMGEFGAFSFHGTKTVTTGEGGMFVTNDDELYEKVLTLSNHGRARGQKKQFWPDVIGFKYKMSNIQAAIGCAQIERIEELVKRKREIFKIYEGLLEGLPLTLNPEQEGTTNGYWMPTLVVDESVNLKAEALLASLRESGIDARVFFHPLSSLGLIEKGLDAPVARKLSELALNLPSFHEMTDTQQETVSDIIHRSCRKS